MNDYKMGLLNYEDGGDKASDLYEEAVAFLLAKKNLPTELKTVVKELEAEVKNAKIKQNEGKTLDQALVIE